MDKNKTLKRMWNLIKPYYKVILIVSFLSLVVGIAEIVKPYLVKIIMDDYLVMEDKQNAFIPVIIIDIIYIAIVLIGNVMDFTATTSIKRVGEKAIYNLRNEFFKYIQYSNIKFHDKTSAGKLFIRITSDIEDISIMFKDVISTIIKDILLIAAFIFAMIYISEQLGGITLIIVPFIFVVSFICTKISNKLQDKSKNVRTELNTFAAEAIYGIKLIKIFNLQKIKKKEHNELAEKYRKTTIPIGLNNSLLPSIMTIIENIGICIIIWACTYGWFNINLQVGVIYMFVTYIKKIFEPINRIVENVETVQDAVVSINKVYDILEDKEVLEDLESGIKVNKFNGKIEFKNVWFAYNNDNWVLKDVSFTIEPGQSIAFVGKTGAGKTTIINLINRFYEIQRGQILIDGIDIKEMNIKDLRERIGIILQDPFIFAKSIKENISMNRDISDEKVLESINMSQMNKMISETKKGLNSIAKEQGNSFSLGEKQLIAFARIFAGNPDIFILDEATSNIDTQTEKYIEKSIKKITKNKTSIFIAHRLSTIVNVDKIILLDKGQIIEEGSHIELIKKDGPYSKLYKSYYEALTNIN